MSRQTFRLPKPRRFLALLVLLSGLPGCAATAERAQRASCPVRKQAELPVTVLRNFVLVPAALNEGKVLMVVDTGAEATTVTPETVASLGLAWRQSGTKLLGIGGLVEGGGTVRLRRMEVGGVQRGAVDLDVGALPTFTGTERPVAGLLGADVLGGYDVEIDMPRQTMALYSVPPCPGFVPPGFTTGDGHAMEHVGGGLLTLSAQIEGRSVRALLDTGARSSLVTRRTAAGLGVTEADLARAPQVSGRGIGAGTVAFHRYRFGEVRVGSVAVRDMTVNVAHLPIAGVDMLLGADWLTGQRVWISRAAGRFYQQTTAPRPWPQAAR